MKAMLQRSFLAIATAAVAGSTYAAAGEPAEQLLVVASASAASAPADDALRPLARPLPEYPVRALLQGVHQASVRLHYTVAADGSVADVDVQRGTPYYGFNQSARRAVSDWRFEPTGRSLQRSVQFVFVAVP